MKRLLESDPDVEEAGLSGDSSPFNAFWFEHHFFQTPDDPRVSVCFFPYFFPKIFSKNWMRKFTGVSPIFDGKNPWVSCKFSPTNQSSERSPWLPPRSLARSSWSKDQRRQVWWFPFDPCDRPLMPWNWVGKLRDYRRGRGGKSMGNFWEIHGNSCNFPWKSWVENMDFMIGSGQSDDWYIHMKFEAETCWVILKQGAPGPHSCDFSGKQQESHDVWVSSNWKFNDFEN